MVVGGQASAPSSTTTSFGPPTVTSIAVANVVEEDGSLAVPTAGGATVVITGVNFGPDRGYVSLTWNGVEVAAAVLSVPHTTLTFPSPPGHGGHVDLALSVAGQDMVAAAGVTLPTLQYGRPVVTQQLLLEYSTVSVPGVVATPSTMDCQDTLASGVPVSGGTAKVVFSGANFGGLQELMDVTIGGVECTLLFVSQTQV